MLFMPDISKLQYGDGFRVFSSVPSSDTETLGNEKLLPSPQVCKLQAGGNIVIR